MHAVKLTSAVVALWLVGLGQTQGGTVTYTDFSDWSNAQSSFTTIGNPGHTNHQVLGIGSSFAFEGVTFTLESEPIFSNGIVALAGGSDPLVISTLNGNEPFAISFLMTFPTPITGFATNFYPTDGFPLVFELETGEAFTFSFFGHPTGAVPSFFGVTNSAPFGSVRVYTGDLSVELSNISYGPVAAAPEPASLTVWGLGLVGFAGMAWRKRKMAA